MNAQGCISLSHLKDALCNERVFIFPCLTQHSSDDFSRAGRNGSLHEVKVLECDIALHSAPWQALATPRDPTAGTHTEQL